MLVFEQPPFFQQAVPPGYSFMPPHRYMVKPIGGLWTFGESWQPLTTVVFSIFPALQIFIAILAGAPFTFTGRDRPLRHKALFHRKREARHGPYPGRHSNQFPVAHAPGIFMLKAEDRARNP
ncbi:hypothetical protein [Desulforudis sp. 1031]|uniref:hypothetical protein n=1 Tax=Desulforudis sp. 1031 TaxID=3416138 RepID=UPI003CEA8272